MYLATIRSTPDAGATTQAAVGDAQGWVALDAPNVDALLQLDGWRAQAASALESRSDTIDPAPSDFLPPIQRPAKILCCGLNYHDHIVETGRDVPAYPTLFAKFADTLLAPHGDIQTHEHERLDWEAELAVIVGSEVHRATYDEAQSAILGYTVANDISMRAWQQRTLQWLQGKAFDATTPIGPWIVTADSVDPKAGLAIDCRVNGEIMQTSNTRELVFDAQALVAYVSSFTRLSPGDIILTGTPGGVALGMSEPRYLNDGDLVETSIEGIGTLSNRVRFA